MMLYDRDVFWLPPRTPLRVRCHDCGHTKPRHAFPARIVQCKLCGLWAGFRWGDWSFPLIKESCIG